MKKAPIKMAINAQVGKWSWFAFGYETSLANIEDSDLKATLCVGLACSMDAPKINDKEIQE